MIEGVKVKQLKLHVDDRGRLMEIFRNDDDVFLKFGQVYTTTVYPGVAKGWHYHKIQYDNFTCVKGKIILALYDGREGSKTHGEVQTFEISMEENPVMVQIPPGVYHGFESGLNEESVVVNVPTEPYNREQPDEYRLPFDSEEIPHKWNAKRGG